MLSYPTRPVWQMSLPNSIKQIKQVLDVTQSVVIICAAIVGGFWAYFKYSTERSEYRVEFPRVLVEHRISHIVLDDGRYVLLFVGVDVKNTGKSKVDIRTAKVWIQQVLPFLSCSQSLRCVTNEIDRAAGKVDRDNDTFSWVGIARREKTFEDVLMVEPNE